MTCNCKDGIEAKLTERFKAQAPEATDHGVTLQGYGYCMSATITNRAYMPYKTTAEFPLKKGGTKVKSTTGSMFFNYCPFCGVKVPA